MGNDIWVDKALEEVVKRMANGPLKLKMDADTATRVKKMYRAGFSNKTEVEWRSARSSILELAEKAGRISEIATILFWVNNNLKPGDYLDKDTVSLVCTAVSRMDCQLKVEGASEQDSIKGGFCPHMDCHEPKIRGQRLKEILEYLGS